MKFFLLFVLTAILSGSIAKYLLIDVDEDQHGNIETRGNKMKIKVLWMKKVVILKLHHNSSSLSYFDI